MMKNKKTVLISVHPEFRNVLKVESALKGQTIFQFTEEIANKRCFVSEYMEFQADKRKQEKKRGGGFNFKF